MSPLLNAWKTTAPIDPPVAIRLLDIIRHLERHDAACCQWVLSLLIFLWQQTGHRCPGPIPSLLLVNGSVNPGPPEADSLLTPLFAAFNHDPGKPAYDAVDESSPAYGEMVNGHRWMVTFSENGARAPESQASIWEKARASVYGSDHIGAYLDRFHPLFGVITPPDHYRIFSVASLKGFTQFRSDLIDPNIDPFRPSGLNGAGHVLKVTPIIGSIPARAFSGAWVDQIATAASPLLLGPYTSTPAGLIPHQKEFQELVFMLGTAFYLQSEPCTRQDWIPLVEGALPYEKVIRGYLRNLPGGYEYFVLNTWRLLSSISLSLLKLLRSQRVDDGPTGELVHQLGVRSARGIAMGLQLLSFRGIGLEISGVAHKRWHKLLEVLRSAAEVKQSRELQRAVGGINASQLAMALDALEKAGLVEVDGKYSRAVPLGDFMRRLGTEGDFPKPPKSPKHWKPGTNLRSQTEKPFTQGLRLGVVIGSSNLSEPQPIDESMERRHLAGFCQPFGFWNVLFERWTFGKVIFCSADALTMLPTPTPGFHDGDGCRVPIEVRGVPDRPRRTGVLYTTVKCHQF